MISKPELGTILNPLEKRFKRLTTEQAEIYHDRLKYLDADVLKDAVIHLIDRAKMFPSPGDIRDAAREKQYERAKSSKLTDKQHGCPQCFQGYVHYERYVKNGKARFVGTCAYCHKGEVTIEPQVIQRDDKIYYACERFTQDGSDHYRANPDIEEIYDMAEPIHTSAWLREYFQAKPLYPRIENIPTYKPRRM